MGIRVLTTLSCNSETGIFTPTLTAGTPGTMSVGYATQIGHYVRVGNLLMLNIHLVLNSFTLGTASGTVKVVTGLPANKYASVLVAAPQNLDLTADVKNVYGFIGTGLSDISLAETRDNTGALDVLISAVTSTTVMRISGSYIIP